VQLLQILNIHSVRYVVPRSTNPSSRTSWRLCVQPVLQRKYGEVVDGGVVDVLVVVGESGAVIVVLDGFAVVAVVVAVVAVIVVVAVAVGVVVVAGKELDVVSSVG